MPGKLITAPTFPLLEARLLDDLQAAVRREPLSPQWLVVPNATLANHLRARLANDAGTTAYAGVRVANLPQFAGRLTAALLGQSAPQWGPLHDLALFDLVEKLPRTSPLANLREIDGGAALLRQVFTDLAEGGFGVEDISVVEELAKEPELSAREREVLQLFARWVRLLDELGIAWSPLLLQKLAVRIEEASNGELSAALCAEAEQQPAVFVYGFYDWIDVNLQWLAALARRLPMTIYYPLALAGGRIHPAFSFAESVLEDLRWRFGIEEEESLETPPSEPGRFFLSTFPEGRIGEQPAFLTAQTAAGVRAEAVSAAVRIRAWLDDETAPLRPEDILVVAPQAEEYVEAVREVFGAFAIPLRVSDVPTGPTPESELLQMLARIWEEQAPAEWVLALLRACPGVPAARDIDRDRFEWKVRELGVWGGAAWRAALEREEFREDDEERGRREIRFDAAERKFIGELLKFVPAQGVPAPNRLPVRDALSVLRLLRDNWVATPTLLDPLIAAAETMARYNPSLEIELRQWTRWLAECGGARTQRDPLCRAVLMLPLMRARGLTARAVVMLGLCAGQLPFRVQDDPLLSEGASARLAGVAAQLGHRLPVKARVTEEMLLLFFLLNTAAERVHWVVPESDATGRAVAPTPWVQRYLQRWNAKKAKVTNPFAARIARAPREQALYLAGLDAKRGSFLPPAMAPFVAPKLVEKSDLPVWQPGLSASGEPPDSWAERAFLRAALQKRGRQVTWSGGIGQQPQFTNDSVSVTAIEALARCPFRFYAQTVAAWHPLEPLSLSRDLDALTRGSLLHKLMELAVRPHLGKRTLGEIAAAMLADDRAALWALVKQLPERAPEAAFGLAMLPPVFKQAALREVVEMAARYFESVTDSTAVPQRVEEKFQRDFPGLSGRQIVGKIDRVDLGEGGPELLDYKSGKKPRDYRPWVRLGWMIQAALYPWLAGLENAKFTYVFLKNEVESGDAKDAPAAMPFLESLAKIVRAGNFIPTSNQVMEEFALDQTRPCSFCKFVSACRRFDPGNAARHAALFRKIAPARFAAIQTAAQPTRKSDASPNDGAADGPNGRGDA